MQRILLLSKQILMHSIQEDAHMLTWFNSAEENKFTAGVLRAVDALHESGLQYTRFAIGMFMDYFGTPNIPSHLRPFIWGVDIAKRRAAIPGSGDEIISMTYSKDVARFIERLLEDGDWPEYSIVSGSDTSFNEILALAQEYTGKYRGKLQKENKRLTSSQVKISA